MHSKSTTKKQNILALAILSILTLQTNCLKNLKITYPYLDKISEPVIGIVTIPTSEKLRSDLGQKYEAYVPSSYKKWIEQTGARPVVIPHFLKNSQIRELIPQLNGILFPGGAPALIM